jgi:hypothetical protein
VTTTIPYGESQGVQRAASAVRDLPWAHSFLFESCPQHSWRRRMQCRARKLFPQPLFARTAVKGAQGGETPIRRAFRRWGTLMGTPAAQDRAVSDLPSEQARLVEQATRLALSQPEDVCAVILGVRGAHRWRFRRMSELCNFGCLSDSSKRARRRRSATNCSVASGGEWSRPRHGTNSVRRRRSRLSPTRSERRAFRPTSAFTCAMRRRVGRGLGAASSAPRRLAKGITRSGGELSPT